MILLLPAWIRKMSLFHDIKLKRRKVDSRCSSDGESVDINTSSPESGPTRDGDHGPNLASPSEHGTRTSPESVTERPPSDLDMYGEQPCPDGSKCEPQYVPCSPPNDASMGEVISDNEEDGTRLVESPQHERRNSVFDGGGRRNGPHEDIDTENFSVLREKGIEGLDLSSPLRQRSGKPPFLWQQPPYRRNDDMVRPQLSPSLDEEQGLALLRLVTQYGPPLVMGDIPGAGPGKTMMWTAQSPNLSPVSGKQENAQQVGERVPPKQSSPTQPTPGVAPTSRPLSPRSQAFAVFTAAATGSPTYPQYNLHNKTSPGIRVANSYPSSRPAEVPTSSPVYGAGSSSSLVLYNTPAARTTNEELFQRPSPAEGRRISQNSSDKTQLVMSSSSPVSQMDSQALNLTVASSVRKDTVVASSSDSRGDGGDDEEDDQPMVCMICEDKATGLHYGIITCEGCKGFFKRTVQNKRVYTCVADGNCEITKAQRNRCQYCRFQKCLRQGMVLAAVREDRMPGGRNSGAVYNLYKVKYKKHKKGQKNGQLRQDPPKPALRYPQQEWANGQILKAALTIPTDAMHLRHRLETWVTSSRDRQLTPEQAMTIISQLIDCDDFEDVATLKNIQEMIDTKADLSDKLCQIGDNIVFKLVQWTKRLPFYAELPVAVHTQLLTHKWHELLVLTTCAYLAIHSNKKMESSLELQQEVAMGLCTLQNCLGAMMDGPITLEQLHLEAGPLVEQLTQLTASFRRLRLCLEEYVCLKVVTMLSQESYQGQRDIESIQERYLAALRVFVENRFPQQANRLSELLARLPEIQAAAALMLQTKMFYVPFLLNTSISR